MVLAHSHISPLKTTWNRCIIILWKSIGYAGLYISQRGVNEGQITVTIFRSSWDQAFYEKLTVTGSVKTAAVPGVYIVTGYSKIETRIIITDELEGKEYAAYRTLKEKPDENDLKLLINDSGDDESTRTYVQVILNLVAEKNPGMIEELSGRDKTMNEELKRIFKKDLDQRFMEGQILTYYGMVQKGRMTIEEAASDLEMTVEEFKSAVDKIQSETVPA